jgi:hypothetical protein
MIPHSQQDFFCTCSGVVQRPPSRLVASTFFSTTAVKIDILFVIDFLHWEPKCYVECKQVSVDDLSSFNTSCDPMQSSITSFSLFSSLSKCTVYFLVCCLLLCPLPSLWPAHNRRDKGTKILKKTELYNNSIDKTLYPSSHHRKQLERTIFIYLLFLIGLGRKRIMGEKGQRTMGTMGHGGERRSAGRRQETDKCVRL